MLSFIQRRRAAFEQWLDGKREATRRRNLSAEAADIEGQIRAQLNQQYRQREADAERRGFDLGVQRTRDTYTAEYAKLRAELALAAEKNYTWVNDRGIKSGDIVQDANGVNFVALSQEHIDELKKGQGAAAGTQRVQQTRKPRTRGRAKRN